MKFKVTEKGVYDAKGNRVKVGAEITVKGDTVPSYLANKGHAVEAAVTNPAKTKKRAGLEKNAEELGIEFSDDTTDDALIDLIEAAKAS
ncbi:hypothetical protein [Rhodovulum sp. FJ3]|uniref:hypothetical protein n=1 Tax=Rhodovulum sp. FJ3 TaxID=3079053 RepID=UPI00293DD495|nr:hypothetical protein [Rhodovulum sp. FJ3]MDV4167808.1 hypothetical protein [Rhodovulum sp. FJ3]